MPVPPGPSSGWGFFAHAPRPSQDLGYALGTSSDAGPSTGFFAGGDDSDDADTDTN